MTAWICALVGCNEVTTNLREDPTRQVFSLDPRAICLLETKTCLRCGDTREVSSVGRLG
jgi:hypothetical protein